MRNTPHGSNTVVSPKIGQAPEQADIIENLLRNQKQKSEETVARRFKTLWNKHKVARIATGLVLAGGAVAATVTGAVAVAGWLLAARTILGAVGGYMATDAALDLIGDRFDKTKLERLVARIERGEVIEDIEQEVRMIHQELGENITTEQIEQAKKSNRRKAIWKAALASVVWFGLGVFGWTHAIEAVTSDEVVSGVKSKVGSILENRIAPVPIASVSPDVPTSRPSIKDIFADIRADHPRQGYVTLEQTVRRIEWLKQGIGLDHSSLLKNMNSSVHGLVHDPNGKVAEAMREMGLLSEGQGVGDVARKLTERQIQEIVTRTYGEDLGIPRTVPDMCTSVWAVGTIGNAAVETAGAAPVPATPTPTWSGISKGMKTFGIIWSVMAFAAWLGWIRSKSVNKERKRKSDNRGVPRPAATPVKTGPKIPHDTMDDSRISNEASSGGDIAKDARTTNEAVSSEQKHGVPDGEAIPEAPASHLADSGSSDSPTDRAPIRPTVSPRIENTEEREAAPTRTREQIMDIAKTIQQQFWFHLDTRNSVLDNEPFILISKKSTVGGMFALAYTEHGWKWEIRIDWLNGDKVGYSIQRVIPTNLTALSPEDASSLIQAAMKILLKETLIMRDKIKSMELRDLHTVEVDRGDLSKIYAQLRSLPPGRRNCETGGYWFQSCYASQNGVLRFENMQNPTLEEMDISGGDFSIIGEKGRAYIGRNYVMYLNNAFGLHESRIILEIMQDTMKEGIDLKPITWAVYNYNWHKHPEWLFHPSSMDLNSPWAASTCFARSPDMQVFTWAIATRLPSGMNETNKPDNVVILRDPDRNRAEDYRLYFCMIRRNEKNHYTYDDIVKLRTVIA